MAKKMLINADMLLATPRKNEPTPQKEEAVKIEAPPSVSEPVVSIAPQQAQVVSVPKKIVEVSSVQKGLKEGETRATFIVREDTLEKIKAIAYWDRLNIKEVMQSAMELYITTYEREKGLIQPIP